MNAAQTALSRAANYIATIGIADIIDILLIAYLIYRIIGLVRRTNLYNLAKGLAMFIIALWVSNLFKLNMTNFILRKAAELGLIALVILFQPELRRLLERVGSSFFHSSTKTINTSELMLAIQQVSDACRDMSESRTGALLVFERKVRLNDVIATGTPIDSAVSGELLKNIFYNKAPLHDGAVIIRNGRVAAAGCVLPLTNSTNLSKELGMRHRAGIGMSEQSDAVVLIVSEESGAISCSIDGNLKRHLSRDAVEELLREELTDPDLISNPKNFFNKLTYAVFSIVKSEDKKSDEKDN
ncbi:MAG: diadenylate cyclase CdaA [Eubacteriales bacterium]|nr:diadenylate cyclase CdaA [Eubacteriales bacterium]